MAAAGGAAGAGAYHGGEALAVKVLEVLNVGPLVATVICDGLFNVALRLPARARSFLAFAALLVFGSAQWWIVGTGASRFVKWRATRRAALRS